MLYLKYIILTNTQGGNMDRFEYEAIINEIKLLQRKCKRIQIEKDYLNIIKPLIIEVKKRKHWNIKKDNLLEEEIKTNNSLLIAYTKLEQLF